jgi:hypothetical protein
MNKKNIFFFSIIITGFIFVLSLILLYTSNDSKSLIKLNFTPKAFEPKSKESAVKIHNSISSTNQNSSNKYNIQNSSFKIYSEFSNSKYMLNFSNNEISVPLMSFYEKPNYKYGLFNDSKSFWILITNPTIKNRYTIFAYYSFKKLTPIKLYESENDENFNQLDVSFSNDIITVISPNNIMAVSKYGQISKK